MKTQDYLVLGLFDGLMQAKKEQEENEKMNDQNIFTEDEKTILKSLPENYKWIARDKNGFIYVYANKPQRGELVFKYQDGYASNISVFKHIFKGVTWKNSPICFRKPILDDIERRYLKTVFRLFHKKIIYVYKELTNDEVRECLFAQLETLDNFGDYMAFPMFEAGTMYKNMELNKIYTLEELGILHMTKPITHRCDGSLEAKASIRYEKMFHDTPPKWYLKIYGINMDWDCVELESITEIKYCPFCGEKLEAPTKKVKSVLDDATDEEFFTMSHMVEKILKALDTAIKCAVICDEEDQCSNSSDQQAEISSKHKMSETSGTNRQDG